LGVSGIALSDGNLLVSDSVGSGQPWFIYFAAADHHQGISAPPSAHGGDSWQLWAAGTSSALVAEFLPPASNPWPFFLDESGTTPTSLSSTAPSWMKEGAVGASLADGRVFVLHSAASGSSAPDGAAAIFDPSTKSFSAIAPQPHFGPAQPAAYATATGEVVSIALGQPIDAFNPTTGTWRSSASTFGSPAPFAPVIARTASGKLFVITIDGTLTGKLYSLDLATLTATPIALSGIAPTTMAAAGGEFLVLDQEPTPSKTATMQLALFDASTGTVVRSLPSPPGINFGLGLVGTSAGCYSLGGVTAYSDTGASTDSNQFSLFAPLALGAACTDPDKCGNGICSGGHCASSCAADSDCYAGTYCKSGACVQALTSGQKCTANTQCLSDACLDNHCCADTHSCAPYVCATVGCTTSCAASSDCATGNVCTGGKCAPPAGGTSKCSDDRTSFTDTAGATHPCNPVLCNVATGICGELCTTNADCAVGTFCESSKQCVPQQVTAAPKSGCALSPGKGSFCCVSGIIVLGMLGRLRRRRNT